MLSSSILALLLSASLIEAGAIPGTKGPYSLLRRATGSSSDLTLLESAIQKGSFNDGSDEIGANEVGQAKSATSQNNFINNCAGKTLTNGLQITTGSCNGISMGDIPAKTNMVSSIITFPLAGSASIESDTTFNITVQMANLVAGSFTNADATYYAAPQALSGGKVVGHTHVTVQDLGKSLNPTTPLDATKFAFFKGINDAGNGEGLLTAVVTGGLPAGNYRVCTMAAAANHQPVLMPVAQRGSPDDCTKFTVIGSGTTPNNAANNGPGGLAAASLYTTAAAGGATDIVTTSAADATTTAVSGGNGSGKGGKGGNGKSTTTTTAASTTHTSGSGKGGNGGNGKSTTTSTAASSTHTSGSGSQRSKGSGVTKEIITIIETFFEFAESALGGAVPPVGKSGDKFNVFDELFDDLAAAAASSCGHQFTACQSFAGPGFSIEECASQRDSCSAAASKQTTTASKPATVTATQVLPVTASATIGSAIATSTVSTSISISFATTATAVAAQTSPAAVGQAVSSASQCSVVTVTATVHGATPTA
ncbi:hypothetical protein OIDMADRAFT_198448 [Oidiodendron maius Zn]|uniref:Uncharacterized protein n=1 Tax=Oidiodendron maius (strain Zn) TaxID=913774 RepID=A0A0C3CQ67_OIDMZ|nr:hypothetical protein OIDMADRAFT_198448 [Oidiodendron maius Zn]